MDTYTHKIAQVSYGTQLQVDFFFAMFLGSENHCMLRQQCVDGVYSSKHGVDVIVQRHLEAERSDLM